METLSSEALEHWLDQYRDWRQEGDALVRSVEAPSFRAGIELVVRAADVAEQRNHHPDMDIRWRAVTFRLSTHSVGGITDADLELAEALDLLIG